MTACLPKASYSIASAGRHKSKSIDRTICLAKPCNGSADLAKAVPNELAARTIAVTIRRAIIGILRSEEHTSELQSLMRISYAVFCLKKKTKHNHAGDLVHHNNYITNTTSTSTS